MAVNKKTGEMVTGNLPVQQILVEFYILLQLQFNSSVFKFLQSVLVQLIPATTHELECRSRGVGIQFPDRNGEGLELKSVSLRYQKTSSTGLTTLTKKLQ